MFGGNNGYYTQILFCCCYVFSFFFCLAIVVFAMVNSFTSAVTLKLFEESGAIDELHSAPCMTILHFLLDEWMS